jgi:hypothetical protein
MVDDEPEATTVWDVALEIPHPLKIHDCLGLVKRTNP